MHGSVSLNIQLLGHAAYITPVQGELLEALFEGISDELMTLMMEKKSATKASVGMRVNMAAAERACGESTSVRLQQPGKGASNEAHHSSTRRKG